MMKESEDKRPGTVWLVVSLRNDATSGTWQRFLVLAYYALSLANGQISLRGREQISLFEACIICVHAIHPLCSWFHPAGAGNAGERSLLARRSGHLTHLITPQRMSFGEHSRRLQMSSHPASVSGFQPHVSSPRFLSLISQSCYSQVLDHLDKLLAISLESM